jgi:hypothetical protein
MRVLSALLLILTLGGCGSNQIPISPTSIAIQGVQLLFSKSVPSEIIVTAKGSGETREKAIENALIAAVQEGIGVLVVSDVTIQNDAILKNIAITYASGVVTNYKVKNCIGSTRQVCEITASVSPWNLRKNLTSSTASLKVDGENLYGQYITTKNTMIQRRKLVDYYFSQIRKNGLDIKITSMKILPTPANIVQIEIDYLVTWNKEFKSNIIEFLIKLERDTEGQFNSKNDGTVVVIAWDGTGFFSDNRVYIRTEDRQLAQFMGHMISDSVSVSIKPFNKCDIFDNTDGVFMIDFYGGKRRKTGIETTPDNLKKIKNIELSLGC